MLSESSRTIDRCDFIVSRWLLIKTGSRSMAARASSVSVAQAGHQSPLLPREVRALMPIEPPHDEQKGNCSHHDRRRGRSLRQGSELEPRLAG